MPGFGGAQPVDGFAEDEALHLPGGNRPEALVKMPGVW